MNFDNAIITNPNNCFNHWIIIIELPIAMHGYGISHSCTVEDTSQPHCGYIQTSGVSIDNNCLLGVGYAGGCIKL